MSSAPGTRRPLFFSTDKPQNHPFPSSAPVHSLSSVVLAQTNHKITRLFRHLRLRHTSSVSFASSDKLTESHLALRLYTLHIVIRLSTVSHSVQTKRVISLSPSLLQTHVVRLSLSLSLSHLSLSLSLSLSLVCLSVCLVSDCLKVSFLSSAPGTLVCLSV